MTFDSFLYKKNMSIYMHRVSTSTSTAGGTDSVNVFWKFDQLLWFLWSDFVGHHCLLVDVLLPSVGRTPPLALSQIPQSYDRSKEIGNSERKPNGTYAKSC